MSKSLDPQMSVAEEVKRLLELEHDTLQAYDEGLRRLTDARMTLAFSAFGHHHARHVAELDLLLRSVAVPTPVVGSGRIRARGRVLVCGLMGARATLRAMRINENETNAAYERFVLNSDVPVALRSWAQSALDEERRHRDWLDDAIDGMGGGMRPEEILGAVTGG
jgi:hypothetical protein